MNRWSAWALPLAFAAALGLRAPQLAQRPLHNDEGVNAVKVAELWDHGRYRYDPHEYHGPLLHYASLPVLKISGARTSGDFDDARLRWLNVAFGAGLILLLPLFSGAWTRHALAWTAFLLAASPAMVFYSRYFIHEMPLVFSTLAAIGTAWRYSQVRSAGWAAGFGLAIGLMFATKETFVLTLAASGLSLATLFGIQVRAGERLRVLRESWNTRHALTAVSVAGGVGVLLFTSFFQNPVGLLDSVRTYLPWLSRAGGDSPHIHPWYFYLLRLAWFHPAKGPAWSEGAILLLGIVGMALSCRAGANPLHRFLALHTVGLTAIYSVISYKTPWCMLNFLLGFILLAGFGAAHIVERFRSAPWRGVCGGVLALIVIQLGWQAWRASFQYASDRRNPYVYAQTVPDLLKLVDRVHGVGRVAETRFDTVVKVMAPDSDYWPLPWYLRQFQNVGWYDSIPSDPYAPVVLASVKLESKLDEKSGRKWIMVGMNELRPGKFFETYVEFGLWSRYVAQLPREIE